MARATLALTLLLALFAYAMAACGTCSFFDPAVGECVTAGACDGVSGSEGTWDCGHCAYFTWDSVLGHCVQVAGCNGK